MRNLIFNKKSMPIFALLLVQQVIVASSTYFLTQAAAKVATGQFPFAMLVAYLVSLFLPFLPGICGAVLQAKWEYHFHEGFLSKYLSTFTGRIDLWRQKSARLNTVGLISQELPQTAQSWTDYNFRLFSTALNVFLNIITVSIVIEASYLWAFALTLAISAIAIWVCKGHMETLSENSQNDRIKLTGVVSSSWNFVTLGNPHSLRLFQDELDETFAKMKASNLKVAKFTGLFSLLMVVIAFTPSLVNTIFVATKWQNSPAMLAALLVVLPRLFMILNFTYDLLQQVFDWTYQSTRIEGLLSGLSPDQGKIQGEVVLEKIRVNQMPLQNNGFETLLNRCLEPGRLTIEGENGSGKTTLLLKLKETLGEKAHYMPPVGEENLKDLTGRSTGQQIHEGICTLLSSLPKNTVLLLDEWNANLDSANKKKISDLIDNHAAANCVVEIVHRAG